MADAAATPRFPALPLAGGVLCWLALLALFFWLNSHADDTRSRRALAVPSAAIELDLAKALSDAAFQDLVKRLTTVEAQPTAPTGEAATTPTAEKTAPAVDPLPKPETVTALDGKDAVTATASSHAAAVASVNTVAPTPSPAAAVIPTATPVPIKNPVPEAAAETAPPAQPAVNQTIPAAPARPLNTLIENSPQGPLPKVSDKGERPWRTYVRAVPGGAKPPMVAVVVQNLGLSDKAIQDVFTRLPREVTLAFNPYGREVDRTMGLARAAGFETLIGVPMQPSRFPQQDPGPRALMNDFSPDQNIEALKWNLGRGSSYVGVISIMGDAFTETAWRIEPIMKHLGNRGVLFLDNSTPRGAAVTGAIATRFTLPYAKVDVVLDKSLAQGDIEAAFANLEKAAKDNGYAVGVLGPYPASLALLERWANGLPKRGVQLVPISATARMRMEGAAP
ncbi:MAG: divergent polysaccharide deacetylase family protein [Alphaproteobacteria bacterium]|jgi:hypothetical protein|nr:divergent polysaccharide deacetylase family protein [Alphaproteobacteria bacterium]